MTDYLIQNMECFTKNIYMVGLVILCYFDYSQGRIITQCKIVCKMHVAQLFVCLSLWNGEQSSSFQCGSHLQNYWCLAAAAQNSYNAGRLKETFENALSTNAGMNFISTQYLFSVSTGV
jgi:hypothetical protein